MKDIIKDIVVHVIELIIGLYFALHIYDQTHSTEYPDYSKELDRIAIEIRNNSKSIVKASETQTDSLCVLTREGIKQRLRMDSTRFTNYVQH